ncbi:MAG: FAD-binding protein, partial [Lachnospiraceae bacterium]|nr:FAD-binding protein [Lachnospiraceae bacterium]
MRENTAMLDYIGERIPAENILRGEPMSRHTSFRIGGEADLFVKVPSIQALSELIRYLAQTGQDYYIVGRGTNLLVGDKGYRGVILQLGEEMSQITVEGTRIIAQAGASLPKVAQVAAAHGLSGLEFAAGIPGSIGGGVVMNAGAYDGEMKQVVKNVLVINQYGEEMNLDNDTMEFGYRTSIIKDRPFVVAQITLQ